MARSKLSRIIRDSVLKKIGAICHISVKKSKESLINQFKFLFQTDLDFAGSMVRQLELSEGEIKYLLGEKHRNKLKDIMQSIEKKNDMQIEIETVEKENNNKKEEKKKEKVQEIKQPSIFDF